ncbi:MAG: 6-bladed beta-propeller [Planctomycetota bacterium]
MFPTRRITKPRRAVLLAVLSLGSSTLASSAMTLGAQEREVMRPKPAEPPSLALAHRIAYPTRIAVDADDNVYVTDIRVGSVFILDPYLQPRLELKGLAEPAGIAVDHDGRIYVGSKGRQSVEVYSGTGRLLYELGAGPGEFSLPTDITVAPDARVFVADSFQNCVKVFDRRGRRLKVIGGEGTGPGEFKFPSSLTLSPDATELYVGDQGNYRIQVFDLNGGFLREFGGHVERGAFEGRFARIQSVATVIDPEIGTTIHVVDTAQNWIQVLTGNGEYLRSYGETGRSPGKLNLPLDIACNSLGRVIVCNSGNGRVEHID